MSWGEASKPWQGQEDSLAATFGADFSVTSGTFTTQPFGYWMKQDGPRLYVRTALLPPDNFDGWEFHEAPTGLLTIDLAGPVGLPEGIIPVDPNIPVPVPEGVEGAWFDPVLREWVVPHPIEVNET